MQKKILSVVLSCLFCAAAFSACGEKNVRENAPSALYTADASEVYFSEETETKKDAAIADDDAAESADPVAPGGNETASGGETDGPDGGQIPSADDVTGSYQNETYTVLVEKTAADELRFTVGAAPVDGKGYQWTITGFFAADTLRVNYSDAVKTAVYYNAAGEVQREETVYENGPGRMQFTGNGELIWMDETEAQGSVTLRKAD